MQWFSNEIFFFSKTLNRTGDHLKTFIILFLKLSKQPFPGVLGNFQKCIKCVLFKIIKFLFKSWPKSCTQIWGFYNFFRHTVFRVFWISEVINFFSVGTKLSFFMMFPELHRICGCKQIDYDFKNFKFGKARKKLKFRGFQY